ncbi:uncharacterized protein LOC133205169 [Saccostrea echinata]|uniref:uncharacterized protein LOC133205169 n=1 Tax=Saccostrea echinata TaxID=191078 RepID=UPI002A80E198|nr:uncharacterized protein LOC133205169 [Saccostrea echinata]
MNSRTRLFGLLKNQLSQTTSRNIASKVRRPDGVLRPRQRADKPVDFERQLQKRDLIWLGVWTGCFLESAYLARRIYRRLTSPDKYIRMKNSSVMFNWWHAFG